MGIDINLNNLFDIKKILSICILIIVITGCSILLTHNGTSIDFLGVKITKVQTAAIDQKTISEMLEE
jgi:hypothetical protein